MERRIQVETSYQGALAGKCAVRDHEQATCSLTRLGPPWVCVEATFDLSQLGGEGPPSLTDTIQQSQCLMLAAAVCIGPLRSFRGLGEQSPGKNRVALLTPKDVQDTEHKG
jgi:hypothetical protein